MTTDPDGTSAAGTGSADRAPVGLTSEQGNLVPRDSWAHAACHDACIGARSDIDTLESLREHLQWAIELEHCTIPPYMCALYSLDPQRNQEASEVIRSILLEEMLHLTLAANILNAVGGRPRLDAPQMLPGYPRCLPHSDHSFEVSLLPLSPEALDLFLRLEQTSRPDGPPESDNYETIGQFYDAIEQGLRDLCADLGEATVFCGDSSRQVANDFYSGAGGQIIVVEGLTSALAALDEVVEQGEGAGSTEVWDEDADPLYPDRRQVAHYYRLEELKLGRRYRPGDTPLSGPTGELIAIDWDGVSPMQRNPRSADHPRESEIRKAQEEFNRFYCALLSQLENAFDGNPKILGSAIGSMYGLKTQARALMQIPNDDGLTVAGPTFEYDPLAIRTR